MSPDLPDRLRELPPELPDVPDRLERVRRLARRRRRLQIGAVAAGTAIAVVVPVVLTSALARDHTALDRQLPAQPGLPADFVDLCTCAGLTIRAVPTDQLTRTRDEVEAVVPKGGVVTAVPALVTDPLAPKVGLGSGKEARPMWLAYRVEKLAVHRDNTGGSFGHHPPFAGAPGMRTLSVTLVDDATLKLGGNFGCKPFSAASDNRGYGIPEGARVTVSGQIFADVRRLSDLPRGSNCRLAGAAATTAPTASTRSRCTVTSGCCLPTLRRRGRPSRERGNTTRSPLPASRH